MSVRCSRAAMGLVLAMALAACSGSSEPSGDAQAARETTAPAPAHDMSAMDGAAPADSSMAGMDHSAMNVGDTADRAGGPARQGVMAGMDHSNMPDMQTSGAPMAGMDHSAMTGTPRGGTAAGGGAQGMSEMDQTNMPGMQTGNASPRQSAPMAGMDHSAMPGMQQMSGASAAADSGAEKLRMLVAQLVQDSMVQRRIQRDSALREAWSKPVVRQEILDPK